MIPQVNNWKVTFTKNDGTTVSTVVTCVKRFAKWQANIKLGHPMARPNLFSEKIKVSLVRA